MKELIDIQAKLKAPKNLYNSFGKYKYRNAEGIMEAVKPLLAEHGCVLRMSDEVILIGERYYVKAHATISNAGGECITCCALAREDDTKKGMDGAQITGTASSYARKYALNGLFLIDDTKDPDTDEYHKQTHPKSNADAAKEQWQSFEAAVADIAACQTLSELVQVWNKHEALRPNKDFQDVMTAKKEALQQLQMS